MSELNDRRKSIKLVVVMVLAFYDTAKINKIVARAHICTPFYGAHQSSQICCQMGVLSHRMRQIVSTTLNWIHLASIENSKQTKSTDSTINEFKKKRRKICYANKHTKIHSTKNTYAKSSPINEDCLHTACCQLKKKQSLAHMKRISK